MDLKAIEIARIRDKNTHQKNLIIHSGFLTIEPASYVKMFIKSVNN